MHYLLLASPIYLTLISRMCGSSWHGRIGRVLYALPYALAVALVHAPLYTIFLTFLSVWLGKTFGIDDGLVGQQRQNQITYIALPIAKGLNVSRGTIPYDMLFLGLRGWLMVILPVCYVMHYNALAGWGVLLSSALGQPLAYYIGYKFFNGKVYRSYGLLARFLEVIPPDYKIAYTAPAEALSGLFSGLGLLFV